MKKIYLLFLFLAVVFTVRAQTRTITGTVTSSDKNEPLIGVSILVKGSTAGTQTDVNGKFSIKVSNMQNVTLGIRYLGYNYQEQTLAPNKTTLDVRLVPSAANNLSEVVVTGYGQQKKATLTGAISVLDLKKVEDVPALSLSAALRGTAPGVSVVGGVARPGQSANITIRNPVSFGKDSEQGTNPLYVIDDVIRKQADFEALDQNEVESISVLKDAEAAIYGVSGANGVVLVRTKRGKSGAPKFSFASSVGVSNATQLPKMMNSTQLAQFTNDYLDAAWRATSTPGVPYDITQRYISPVDGMKYDKGVATGNKETQYYTTDEMDYFANNSTNWLDKAFNNAYVYREALSMSGGTDKLNYFIGGDYVNQTSNFKGVNSYKYGLRANIDAKPTKGLNVSVSLSNNVNFSKSYWYKLNSTTESLDNDVASLQLVYPWQQYYINGNPVILGPSTSGGIENVNFFLVQNSNNFTSNQSYVMNMLGKVTYEIPGIKGLSATATINKNINSSNNKQFGTTFQYFKYAGTGANNHIPGGALVNTFNIKNGDRVRLNPVFSPSYQLDAGLNYNRSFGKHNLTVLALWEQRENSTEGVAAMTEGVVVGALPYQTFTVGTQTSTQSGQLGQNGFQSFISRLNYDYDNKYILQLVYRADGSSRFAPGNNWGSFPAASVGWVVSQEGFFKKNVKWMDFFKLRASVGITGTDATKAYQYMASYNLGTGSSGGAVFNNDVRSIAIKTNVAIPNADVTWDHVTKTDYGFDMEFLKNRLTVSGDYFWNHGYNLLATLSSSVPATIGAAVPTENHNIVNMFGYEVSAGWRDHIGSKFTYSFTPFFTWFDNKNVLIDVASGDVGTLRDLTGKSSDQGLYGFKSLGIIRTQADADAIIAERAAAAGGASKVKIKNDFVQPGMINYVDVNGDGIIDDNDKTYVSKRSSNHNSLGLNWSLGYAGFNLNVVMGMAWGGKTSIGGIKATAPSGNSVATYDNRAVYWTDHWTPTNPNAKYPNPYFSSIYEDSDFWLVSSTTLNITNATLSYTLPSKISNRLGLSNIRLYTVATNPIQFINPFPSHYRDFASALATYPALRTFSFGLNVGF
ncbi:SusC/RagA family TonB-linked outer membrane protein [Mucilaginibacter sp. RS28]|uniref:SusC/RagA family TonB-linked outer membrane protein n=1 Tax=Mucilaginibacter straminoryzae TaxID=2932774 RepID=A0A9X1X469_9SPHI|nr:SusC/RagA family TonB-linked outer membrane protein [Mucilaginibacter straminoryzae]MCJ8210020.1 SusC/RagA family TonB-linked outer membrane protein [Mucilaginibacter straminoryzae]